MASGIKNTAFRDLIAEVIFDNFASAPGETAIPCTKITGEVIADLILERAQERGLIPFFQAPELRYQQQQDQPLSSENRERDIPHSHRA